MSSDQDTPVGVDDIPRSPIERVSREEHIANLRLYADWLEAHPEAAISEIYSCQCVWGASEMLGLAKMLGGKWDKRTDQEDWFELERHFGPSIKHGLFTDRAKVCERVVVGMEEVQVEEPDPAVVAALPKVKRTEKREKVEWRCPESLSALAKGGAA